MSNETSQRQGTGQEVNSLSELSRVRDMSQPAYVTEQREWNRVHAQLLKSVADAQAKLLAAQNETNDRLERMDRDLRMLIGQTQETVRTCHGNISGRLDGVNRGLDGLTDLARPTLTRRQVEKLRPKRIVKRAVERKR